MQDHAPSRWRGGPLMAAAAVQDSFTQREWLTRDQATSRWREVSKYVKKAIKGVNVQNDQTSLIWNKIAVFAETTPQNNKIHGVYIQRSYRHLGGRRRSALAFSSNSQTRSLLSAQSSNPTQGFRTDLSILITGFERDNGVENKKNRWSGRRCNTWIYTERINWIWTWLESSIFAGACGGFNKKTKINGSVFALLRRLEKDIHIQSKLISVRNVESSED
ncbi:hypothetical protein V6N11_054642 [Hibiscus sabdariffa]|uniref:Uncharacterized protein n=1 Tax=Hibiscus sabdariffa TaxID=183260 RepID=A0ABR2S5A8_9ROSI